MRPRVAVWLAGRTAGELTPPPRSIIDGSEGASVVRACCLDRTGPGRLAVSLPVDAATASQISRTCRLETAWKRRVLPAVLAAVALLVIVFVIDAVANDSRLLGVLLLIALAVAFSSLAGRFALILLRSPHHPRLVKGDVLIRAVDRETAELWASLNPETTIKIHSGGHPVR